MRVLIAGCGYVGVPLGAELARRGHEVFGLRRSRGGEAELHAAGITLLVGDVTQPGSLAALPGPFDWIVNTVAAGGGGVEDYRKTYLEGTRHLISWLRAATPEKYVYTSSTSVYGQEDGSVVDETSPTAPESPTSQVLVETERLLLCAAREQALPAVILRVAGIYGPGRGYWFKQFLQGEARLTDGGERVSNMIHQDDVAGCLLAALERGRGGEVYNAVDDEPVRQADLYRWLAAQLNRPVPPASAEPVSPSRKRGLTNKRVSNQKLKTGLGYVFQYPTFREGYAVEVERQACGG